MVKNYILEASLALLILQNTFSPTSASPLTPSLNPLTPQPNLAIYNTTNTLVTSILSFWFTPSHPYAHWFTPSPTFDAQITTRYGPLIPQARDTPSLDHWTKSPEACLALILVLDQFPRNIYRDNPLQFASDGKALRIATLAIERGFDRAEGVSLIQQMFFYLPFMHAEDLGSQDRGVGLYEKLRGRCPVGDEDWKWFDDCVDFARRHRRVIEMFGRFPGRNEVLGRVSTGEEIEFLKTHPWGY